MADSFSTLYNEIVVMVPFVPVVLAKRWISRRFREAQLRNLWAAQRAESSFHIPAPYTTGTVTGTNGSDQIDGSGTVWTSALVGHQFFINARRPFYTVRSVEDATNLTLDRPFIGADFAAVTYEINYIYLVPPSDFLNFDTAVDLNEERPLRVNVPTEYLDWRDPDRTTSSGTPRMLVQANFSPVPATLGIPRYELWERTGTSRDISYVYFKEYPFSADADVLPTPFQAGAIIEGAMANLCRWWGIGDRKNPYFDLRNATDHENRFNYLIGESMVRDQEIYQTDVSYHTGHSITDPNWIREHDVDFDFYGGY